MRFIPISMAEISKKSQKKSRKRIALRNGEIGKSIT